MKNLRAFHFSPLLLILYHNFFNCHLHKISLMDIRNFSHKHQGLFKKNKQKSQIYHFDSKKKDYTGIEHFL